MSFAAWLTGLSGSGKSAIARELVGLLHERGVAAALLESDAMRAQLTPFPRYDEADRDFFYGALGDIGALLVAAGRPVIFDATANRRRYRDAARRRIARFMEVYVDTPLEVCRARDTKGLYRAGVALPGVVAPYEPPLAPELVVHGDRGTPGESARAIADALAARGWLAEARGPLLAVGEDLLEAADVADAHLRGQVRRASCPSIRFRRSRMPKFWPETKTTSAIKITSIQSSVLTPSLLQVCGESMSDDAWYIICT